jgi:hypothetical protein
MHRHSRQQVIQKTLPMSPPRWSIRANHPMRQFENGDHRYGNLIVVFATQDFNHLVSALAYSLGGDDHA